MTITTPLNCKRTSSILFNEEMNPKLSPYSAYTQAPKKRNRNDENNTDNKKPINDQTPQNHSDWMFIDTCTTRSNSNNLTSTT